MIEKRTFLGRMIEARQFMRALTLIVLTMLAGAAVTLVGCDAGPGPSQVQKFALKGKVISLDKEGGQVVVDHEAIPGFMGAMAMPYPVADETVLDKLTPGDEIHADVVVTNGHPKLENIVVDKKSSGPPPAPAGSAHQPQEGEEVPDFALVNQDGKRISLRQFRGKAVLLTFIYTRCPLPDYCPLMSTNFSVIEEALKKDPKAFAKTHLLSISFDTKNDTPAVLRKYGAGYLQSGGESTFRHWEFTVPPANGMEAMGKFFGLLVQEEKGQIVHSMSTAIISPDGNIYRWYHGNDWKSADVLKDLVSSLGSAGGASQLESEHPHAHGDAQ